MPTISLTDFVDFAIKSGTPKLTKVRAIKSRGDYEPAFDYWKQLREGIDNFHRTGEHDKAALTGLISSLQNPRKIGRYSAALRGYRKFLGKRAILWFDPPRGDWSYGELTVRVNPELGLRIDDARYLVKLYFKDESPTKNRVQIVLEMMNAVLGTKIQNTEMAVLDVTNGRLLSKVPAIPQLTVLLEAEAAAFLRIWAGI